MKVAIKPTHPNSTPYNHFNRRILKDVFGTEYKIIIQGKEDNEKGVSL